MPYLMKIQPIDFTEPNEPEQMVIAKPVLKLRFKRLFERRPPHKLACTDESDLFEPSSICLAKMVQNFIEENNNNEKPQQKCGRRRCSNCFNGNCTDVSDEDDRDCSYSFTNACDVLKSLVTCECVYERNLLADVTRIVQKQKVGKVSLEIVTDGLKALGYNASVCKSKWEKSSSFPAGEYEYVDVVIDDERFIIDIDFRSEFEIARSTKSYKLILQTLPNVFVAKSDRIEKVIDIVSEAAKHSLKKKGMPFPPWRKAEYVKLKWLSPFTKLSSIPIPSNSTNKMNFGDKSSNITTSVKGVDNVMVKKWEPPEIKPRKSLNNKGVKIVTGLASIMEDKS